VQTIPVVFAKLAAHFKTLRGLTDDPRARYFDPRVVLPLLQAVGRLFDELRAQLPELYADLAKRDLPESSKTSDNEGRGYIHGAAIDDIIRDLDYVFEVRAGSHVHEAHSPAPLRRIFISHGRSPAWREVQVYLEKDLALGTLELAQEPSRGRTILQKLVEESDRCSYAVIVMTGDDAVDDGPARARENVIHEIGFFQGSYGLSRVALLYEEGTNIPSNIHGLVYIPFPKDLVSASFATLQRELKAAYSH
jgi:predicted nucleotide-binding protein